MNVELGPTLTALRDRAAALARRVRFPAFWLRLVGITLVAMGTLGIVGRSAHARAEALQQEAIRLERIQTAMDRWAGTVVWPTEEEMAAWRSSETLFARLGGSQAQPLALIDLLSRRGDEIGVADVQIRMASADSVYVPPPSSLADWTVTSGRTALAVDLAGDMGSMISFLGALPPQLELGQLTLSTTEGDAEMYLLLLSREISRSAP